MSKPKEIKPLWHLTATPRNMRPALSGVLLGDRTAQAATQRGVNAAHALRGDGPTLAEWLEHGYPESTYPPPGYARREEPHAANLHKPAYSITCRGCGYVYNNPYCNNCGLAPTDEQKKKAQAAKG